MATQKLPEVLATISIEGEAREMLLSFARRFNMSPYDVLDCLLQYPLQLAVESVITNELPPSLFRGDPSPVLRTA